MDLGLCVFLKQKHRQRVFKVHQVKMEDPTLAQESWDRLGAGMGMFQDDVKSGLSSGSGWSKVWIWLPSRRDLTHCWGNIWKTWLSFWTKPRGQELNSEGREKREQKDSPFRSRHTKVPTTTWESFGSPLPQVFMFSLGIVQSGWGCGRWACLQMFSYFCLGNCKESVCTSIFRVTIYLCAGDSPTTLESLALFMFCWLTFQEMVPVDISWMHWVFWQPRFRAAHTSWTSCNVIPESPATALDFLNLTCQIYALVNLQHWVCPVFQINHILHHLSTNTSN